MKENKTYDLKKVFKYSIVVSFILTLLIYLSSLTLGRFQELLLEDKGASWYYWKLPELDLLASISAWVLYLAHQFSVWIIILKIKKEPMPMAGRVTGLNLLLLITNGIFVIFHIVQTMLFYDGLAQNLPVMSSQGSVIVMLVLILIILNPRRGLFFGKSIRLPENATNSVLKYHGLYISWALVYTFWFHPTEGTLGHLMGFLYMFLLMIQMSLINTTHHFSIKWITVLEVYVAVHGAIVAVEQGNGMWPMFLFGFLFMFVVTQAYGIIDKKSALLGITASYVISVLVIYSGILGNDISITDIHQITWIPIILYALVFVISYMIQSGFLIAKIIKK